VTHRGNWGIYGLGEKVLLTKPDNPSEFMSAFIRAGISDGNINYIDAYRGCGIVFSQSFIRHDQDQLGLAVAAAHISSKAGDVSAAGNGADDRREIALELSYRAQVNSIFSLQPDIQYVINPGFDPSLENALLVGVRVEPAFQ